ncbi:hypothetical protein ARMA_1608 [Ardenticatena maritima]|uniref:Uncharacterized protein n=1 Tax=Ardenticatena maritima TaxID=872965 RepID=A0A0M8K774_9CHLR|nr:hypothetical protein [Ardenticatena maritima]GAP63185.1 hypothetical protein ARMA_1608 [Ardenticatena maritima]
MFTTSVPAAFTNTTVEYQFFIAPWDNNCSGGESLFTGFNWTFSTGPTAVTLQTLRAERSPTHSRMLTLAVSGLLALAGGVLLVRTRRRV